MRVCCNCVHVFVRLWLCFVRACGCVRVCVVSVCLCCVCVWCVRCVVAFVLVFVCGHVAHECVRLYLSVSMWL